MKVKQTDVNGSYPCDILYPMIEELNQTSANVKDKLKKIIDILIKNDFHLRAYVVDGYKRGDKNMRDIQPIEEWHDTDVEQLDNYMYQNIVYSAISFSCIFNYGSKDRAHQFNISLILQEGYEVLAPDYTDINSHSDCIYNEKIIYKSLIDCRETGSMKTIEFGYDFDKLVKLLKMDYYEFMVCFKNGKVS